MDDGAESGPRRIGEGSFGELVDCAHAGAPLNTDRSSCRPSLNSDDNLDGQGLPKFEGQWQPIFVLHEKIAKPSWPQGQRPWPGIPHFRRGRAPVIPAALLCPTGSTRRKPPLDFVKKPILYDTPDNCFVCKPAVPSSPRRTKPPRRPKGEAPKVPRGGHWYGRGPSRWLIQMVYCGICIARVECWSVGH